MAELRRLDPKGHSRDDRRRLRALAVEFPGALRELDVLPTDEIERRRAALEAAAAGGPVDDWMAWLCVYHQLMRAALAAKSRLGQAPDSNAATLAAEIAADLEVTIDDAFIRAVAAPPHGRLNVVVFARLGELFGAPAGAIWDALFPPRGNRPRRHRM
jgi:hypothetical protein